MSSCLKTAQVKMIFESIYVIYTTVLVLVSITQCGSYKITPYIQRKLEKSGFHRELTTYVEWAVKPRHRSDIQSCAMLLLETLPTGLYIDPFQIQSQLQFGGPKLLVDGPVDIESPEHLSPQHTVHVFQDLKMTRHYEDGTVTLLTAMSRLPVHLRYHKPTEEPNVIHVDVIVRNPRFFTNCSMKGSVSLLQAPCDHFNSSLCLWQEHFYDADWNAVMCSVPVGNLEHLSLVVIVTLLVTALGCLFIIYVVVNKDLNTKIKTS